MSIIQTHDITLYGGSDSHLILRPLCDDHLPLLYKWNADPEVLYWTEGGEDIARSYDADTVNGIYGGVSAHAHCFLIEHDGVPIGECWLQRMNLLDVMRMYPQGTDVRRIDMAIGEKAYWGRGIGSKMIGMLVDFAFCGEHVDVLHCFCEDYNARSRRVWEKYGFVRVLEEPLPQPQKGAWQYHYRLTRAIFIESKRTRVPAHDRFSVRIADLQPSQLYVSEGKLRLLYDWFDGCDRDAFDPIPVKRWRDDAYLMTDGHTRAVAAAIAGWWSVPAFLDEDDLDMDAYATCVSWCEAEDVRSPIDLVGRVVPHDAFERIWRKRCMERARRR